MQDTSQFLRAALQVGPWRITRKILLFVIVFCVVIIFFGTIVLKTHMFDEDFEWDDDDWDDSFSGGDSVLLIIIGLSGVGLLVSSVGCCMSSYNSPEQLNDTGVFTLSGVTQNGPVASAPQAVTRQPRQPRQHRRSHRSDEVKSYPPATDYPQGPSFPSNPGYPPNPPPYSAPSYPAPSNAQQGPPAPSAHTIADLPPPYAPGHFPNQR